VQPAWTEASPHWVSRLDAGSVDLWSIGLDALGSPTSDELLGALCVDERRRMARFRRASDARRWGLARGVTRKVLASYIGVPTSEVVFHLGESGKPTLEGVGDGLHFNVSHCGPMALLAVARGYEVGVDVERIREGLHEGAIAQRVLGDEAGRLAMIASPEDRTRAFFRSWVRHEAVVKCRGVGLLDLAGEEPIDDLWIEDIDLGEAHAAALVVNVGVVESSADARPQVRRLAWRNQFSVGG
jgi:4'-phosphopantetheinyl transferase